MIAEYMDKEEYAIIILDSCRYGYYRLCYREHIDEGRLEVGHSSGSCTLEFLINEFSNKKFDCIVISGCGFLAPRLIRKEVHKFDGSRHFRTVIWTWHDKWNDTYDCVLPRDIYQDALMNIYPRMLIWFLQPHFPAIGKTMLLRNEIEIERLYEKGKLSLRMITRAYKENLELALTYVARLMEELPHKLIIITSDHGTYLGEKGRFDHPCGSDDQVLRLVPLHIIERY